jgi:hypothetical protein
MTVSPFSDGHEEMMVRFVVWRKVGRCPFRGHKERAVNEEEGHGKEPTVNAVEGSLTGHLGANRGANTPRRPEKTPPAGVRIGAAVCLLDDEKGRCRNRRKSEKRMTTMRRKNAARC